MMLSTAQAYDLLGRYGAFAREACDKCGTILGAVRYTRRGEDGAWCSRGCRGDSERPGVRKGGRPRKYRNAEQLRSAKTGLQRVYRQVAVWKKPSDSSLETKDLQARL